MNRKKKEERGPWVGLFQQNKIIIKKSFSFFFLAHPTSFDKCPAGNLFFLLFFSFVFQRNEKNPIECVVCLNEILKKKKREFLSSYVLFVVIIKKRKKDGGVCPEKFSQRHLSLKKKMDNVNEEIQTFFDACYF